MFILRQAKQGKFTYTVGEIRIIEVEFKWCFKPESTKMETVMDILFRGSFLSFLGRFNTRNIEKIENIIMFMDME